MGDCGRALDPASYTRSFSLRVATWNRNSQSFRVPDEHQRRELPHPQAQNPGHTPMLLSLALLPPSPHQARVPYLPATLCRWAPHLSLELLADGGVLADVTVQADHIALQLQRGHGGEMSVHSE